MSLLFTHRDFVAQVVNIDGINILTTPTETSVWRGRIEKDKVHDDHNSALLHIINNHPACTELLF